MLDKWEGLGVAAFGPGLKRILVLLKGMATPNPRPSLVQCEILVLRGQ